jgi:hypothetical protein
MAGTGRATVIQRVLLVVAVAGMLTIGVGAAGRAGSPPTWNQDVAPIMFASCVTCHQPGEVAPMSLLTYEEARPWARGIKTKVVAREMPPWFADSRHGKFDNNRGLTQAQIDTIIAWADAGAPRGTGPSPAVPDIHGRSAEVISRPPDAVVEMPVEMEIPPRWNAPPGFLLWEKAPFLEDKYVEAVELRPGNRAVTHHSRLDAVPLPRGAHHLGMAPAWPGGPPINGVPVLEDGTPYAEAYAATQAGDVFGEEAIANQGPFEGNQDNLFMHYAPGTRALKFKPGYVKVIKRDDYLRFMLHYNPTGRTERDRHSVLLWFSSEPQVREVRSKLANEVNLLEGREVIGQGVRRPNIPAQAENYRVASLKVIDTDTTINSIWPHMHLRGKDTTYFVTYPDGREEVLLSIPKYSFEWQIHYIFEEPVKVPAGSILRVVTHYDNSSKNKLNPAPDQELPWGGESWHEMYFPMVDFSVDHEVIKKKAQGEN